MIKIGGATVNQIPFDWNNNTRNILEAIEEARRQQIRILCFPELCVTGYGCEDLFLSDWLAEHAWKEVLKIRDYTQDITICIGLPIRLEGITYNGSCVISNGKIIGITFKQNLARDGVHYEPRWFDPWVPYRTVELTLGGEKVQAGDLIYEIEGVKFGFEICEDGWRKNYRPGYRLMERGVNLILNPSASHFAMGKSTLREREVVLDGSVSFNCVYLFTNLLGNEAGKMIYDGDIIIAQKGKLLAVNKRLSFRNYTILACSVDFKNPEQSEVIPSADVKDRNEELTQAVALALYDYARKSKAKGFVLSLSGGADSSSCAVFVAEMVKRAVAEVGWDIFNKALGIEANDIKEAVGKLLTCAYQGTINSSSQTFNAAKSLADSIGAEFHQWTINDEVNSYSRKIENAIGRKLTWEQDDVTLQNIQARSRSPIIWMLANVKRAVLLTTSNRSEGDVGYATMDGDTSGSLSPIAGLSKVFILQWLRWAEKNLNQTGLNLVNNLQPTAELRPLERNQTDEDDLMPYAVLAEIEKWAILMRRSPLQVYEVMKINHDPAMLKNWIRKFFRLWSANQWKRERLAPAFHLDDLNVDPRTWCRFPILSSGFTEELAKLDQY
ncbi:NAD(+) synthase [Ohtaekwangia kribbensis]|jgi:NAD+ synthase (glutamine-hydrolysing)|uniref:Glutamine-dependent NAD(+) synthetase n=1 Tax=Ohtaekwangia kribbensis TaxID=688913 RepID=A0ABW3JY07_9BACT